MMAQQSTPPVPAACELLNRLPLIFWVVGLFNILSACEEPVENIEDYHFEWWDDGNDPAIAGAEFEFSWDILSDDSLSLGAVDRIPWPGSYWAAKSDGFNHRWRGRHSLSPVELYDLAFNGWLLPPDFFELEPFSEPGEPYDDEYYRLIGPATEWAHEEGGTGQARAVTSPDGTPLWDVEDGPDADWGGIHDWFGHCHSWAAAAISHEEPQKAVTFDGVEFQVSDIKALLAASYEGVEQVIVGNRCNTSDPERDDYGRILERECRDVDPGAFHVVMLNLVGLRQHALIMDGAVEHDIWNQPVRDYHIQQQVEVTLTEALRLVGRTDIDHYPYNPYADRFVHVVMEVRYVSGAEPGTAPLLTEVEQYTDSHRLEYVLELDGQGNIIGGEWLNDSWYPDFLWFPQNTSDDRRGQATELGVLSNSHIRVLLERSRDDQNTPEQ